MIRAFPLDPDQIASLDYVTIAEPDAADVLFSGLRIERRNKHTIIDGEWVERPMIVTLINGQVARENPETLEFRP